MVKLKLLGLIGILVVSSLGMLFSVFIWVTNVIFAVPQWRFGLGIEKFFKELQQIDLFQRLSSIYVITIDLSTITTFVIMITLACVTLGIWKVFLVVKEGIQKERLSNEHPLPSGKDKINAERLDVEHFPFWSTYKTFFVQLGLLGTLFGFIVAFKQASGAEGSYEPQIIFQALGTALWSTFSAILLAFVVCPVFFEKLLFGYLINVHRLFSVGKTIQSSVEEDIQTVSNRFHSLSERVSATVISLEKFTTEVNNLSVQKVLGELSFLQNELRTLKDQINSMEQNIDTLLKGQGTKFHEIKTRIDEVEQKTVEQNEKIKKMALGLKTVLEDSIGESNSES